MHPLMFKFADPIARWKKNLLPTYRADGLAVSNKNLSFLADKDFDTAWRFAERGNLKSWKDNVPDIRWRAHMACWAATTASRLPGDFVECGVFTGLLSMTVLKYLQGKNLGGGKSFYLFDTFNGIPIDGLIGNDRVGAECLNREIYFDCFDIAQRNFESFPNAKLIKGVLPASLTLAQSLKSICYLSMDLNGAGPEMATIENLWPMLVPGAIILLDDFAFEGHEKQHSAWSSFALSHSFEIATLPTGQGLIVKPR
jgi:O-methyltransferase